MECKNIRISEASALKLRLLAKKWNTTITGAIDRLVEIEEQSSMGFSTSEMQEIKAVIKEIQQQVLVIANLIKEVL